MIAAIYAVYAGGNGGNRLPNDVSSMSRIYVTHQCSGLSHDYYRRNSYINSRDFPARVENLLLPSSLAA